MATAVNIKAFNSDARTRRLFSPYPLNTVKNFMSSVFKLISGLGGGGGGGSLDPALQPIAKCT